jgi:hypothetical protein
VGTDQRQEPFKRPDVDERIILKWILKMDGFGFIWPTTWTTAGLL